MQHFLRKMLHGKNIHADEYRRENADSVAAINGFKPGQIARELGSSAGTLSHELKRNGWVRPKLARGDWLATFWSCQMPSACKRGG